MNPKPHKRPEGTRRRQQHTAEIRAALRALGIQLALLNHHVSARLELNDVDLDCLNLIDSHGPLSPSALARHSGLHPATITGILDRLERGGWVSRERDPADRRGVLVRALRERNADLMRLYSGMNVSMNKLLAGYDDSELELLADFLRRTANAGKNASTELAGGGQAPSRPPPVEGREAGRAKARPPDLPRSAASAQHKPFRSSS